MLQTMEIGNPFSTLFSKGNPFPPDTFKTGDGAGPPQERKNSKNKEAPLKENAGESHFSLFSIVVLNAVVSWNDSLRVKRKFLSF